MKKEEPYMEYLINSIMGNRNDLERLLLTKGLSPVTVEELMAKVEIIIEFSGKLGRLIQREADIKDLRALRLENHKLKKGSA